MSSTPETLDHMIELLTEAREDYNKFYNDGNNAAGTRVRKVMQEIKGAAQNVRVHVQDTKNNQ
jgi:hypothetical protein